MNRPRLILASASPIRRQLLDQAGVVYDAIPANIDEAALKVNAAGATDAATALARAKAEAVAQRYPSCWVIGSDSIVTIDGRHLDKPRDREEAAAHLRWFSGRSMVLTSAVALCRSGDGEAGAWSHCDQALLHVRALSEQFIEQYLDDEWPAVAYCVGVFRLEGVGVTLFDRIDGDYFTILGMPLLPLLGALRERGLVRS